MSNNYLQFKSALEKFGCDVKADEPMKNHTSFKIGGSADLFVTVSDLNQLTDVISFCLEKNIPLFVLGNGSNLLVSDKGIRGLVLRLGSATSDLMTTVRCTAARVRSFPSCAPSRWSIRSRVWNSRGEFPARAAVRPSWTRAPTAAR